ncbi:MAG: metallophosphoesterase, partial [Ruminococcus sp.]|nr:metallophosphoesterase [Ruminococcus sp.]
MVYVTGDMHGDYNRFKDPAYKRLRTGDVLIVCGDFGFIWNNSRQEKAILKKLREKRFTIAFIDGCHENFDLLEKNYKLVRWRGGVARLIAPNIFHMQRGEVYTIDNKKFFTFGGGHSQDFEYRYSTGNWWKQEQPTHAEIKRAIHNLNLNHARVDYIITHEPPASLKDCL